MKKLYYIFIVAAIFACTKISVDEQIRTNSTEISLSGKEHNRILNLIQKDFFSNVGVELRDESYAYDSLLESSIKVLTEQWSIHDTNQTRLNTFVEQCANFGYYMIDTMTNSEINSHFSTSLSSSSITLSTGFLNTLLHFNNCMDTVTSTAGVEHVQTVIDLENNATIMSVLEHDILEVVTSTAVSSYEYWETNSPLWSNELEIRACPKCKKIAKADANGIVQGMSSGFLVGLLSANPVGVAVGTISGGIGGGAVGSAFSALGWDF